MKEKSYKKILLIKQLKEGDKNAYSLLVELYNHKLCVYANSLVNDYMLAEDIVQNVFIKVWERRKKLNKNYSLNNYLYKLVYNEFIDQYRKQKSVLLLEKTYIQTLNKITSNKDDIIAMQRMIDLVMRAINKLPTRQKKIFLLSKKEGLTNIEIAEYLNISVKSVEGHITKAYSIIREMLKGKVNTVFFLIFRY